MNSRGWPQFSNARAGRICRPWLKQVQRGCQPKADDQVDGKEEDRSDRGHDENHHRGHRGFAPCGLNDLGHLAANLLDKL